MAIESETKITSSCLTAIITQREDDGDSTFHHKYEFTIAALNDSPYHTTTIIFPDFPQAIALP